MSAESLPSPASLLPVPAWDRLTTPRKRGKRYAETFEPRGLATAALAHFGTWRAVAEALGHSAGYWNHIARGDRHMSRREENDLRLRLGLAPRGVTKIERMSKRALTRYLMQRREMR